MKEPISYAICQSQSVLSCALTWVLVVRAILRRRSINICCSADDNLEKSLDLNSYLIKRPAATFFVRVNGDSMINAGINDNDILVVDRSIKPAHGKVIIAVLDGQMTVKRLYKRSGKIILMPENDLYKPIEIQDHMNMEIWGVVTSSVHFL